MASTIMINPDHNDNDNDPMDLMRLAAMNINGLSQQMGLMNKAVSGHEQRILALESFQAQQEHTQTLAQVQTKNMNHAVHARVRHLLYKDGVVDITVNKRYYAAFCRKLWNDAKYHSKMAQDYKFTLAVDYEEVMAYIASWFPEGYDGVEGYKEYLDKYRAA